MALSALMLVGCGGNDTESKDEPAPKKEETTKTENKAEPTQEELNEKLKAEAVEANFVELNSDKAETNKKVFATGEVSAIKEDGIFQSFTLTTKEGEGNGMYSISDVLKETEYAEGDTVKVYGVYTGKDDLGFPKIESTVIEKQ